MRQPEATRVGPLGGYFRMKLPQMKKGSDRHVDIGRESISTVLSTSSSYLLTFKRLLGGAPLLCCVS